MYMHVSGLLQGVHVLYMYLNTRLQLALKYLLCSHTHAIIPTHVCRLHVYIIYSNCNSQQSYYSAGIGGCRT